MKKDNESIQIIQMINYDIIISEYSRNTHTYFPRSEIIYHFSICSSHKTLQNNVIEHWIDEFFQFYTLFTLVF